MVLGQGFDSDDIILHDDCGGGDVGRQPHAEGLEQDQ
jgi:hypothetical protein